jgi:hypothetical protein
MHAQQIAAMKKLILLTMLELASMILHNAAAQWMLSAMMEIHALMTLV